MRIYKQSVHTNPPPLLSWMEHRAEFSEYPEHLLCPGPITSPPGSIFFSQAPGDIQGLPCLFPGLLAAVTEDIASQLLSGKFRGKKKKTSEIRPKTQSQGHKLV